MTTTTPTTDDNAVAKGRFRLRDDWAYILPMAVFLILTQVGATWKSLYVESYVAKTLIVPVLLWMCWRHYTKIQWSHLGLGVIVGVVGLVQWVGMEKLLIAGSDAVPVLAYTRMADYDPPDPGPLPGEDPAVAEAISEDASFNPFRHFEDSPAWMLWGFILLRWLVGASLVVPVMEELFWRDWVWREIIAPNNFRLARIGEWDTAAVFGVAAVFAFVHIQILTAFVWGLLIAWLLLRTKSIGACIVAHAVTNLLLGAYVLYTRDWYFW